MRCHSSWPGHFARCLLLALLLFSQVSAIIDSNNNGLSDLWEKTYNNGDLFPSTFDPQADPDGDGWTNEQEAAAGTNPFDANQPGGCFVPTITRIPATYYDPNADGIPDILTPETVTLVWPTVAGKCYTLECSPDLAAGNWQIIDDYLLGDGTPMGQAIPLTQPDGSLPEKLFWRVLIQDIDSDGDGLTDAEEYQLGTNPNNRDTDGDGVSDWDEVVVNGTNPLSAVDIIGNSNGIPDDLEKHLAKQLLDYQPDPAAWGAYYPDLALGQLDATHDYTGDGISAGSLANLLRSAPVTSAPAGSTDSEFLMESQEKSNVLDGYAVFGSTDGIGTYFASEPEHYDPLTSVSDFTSAYLVSHIDSVPWRSAYGHLISWSDTWGPGVSGSGQSGFLVAPYVWGGANKYNGMITQKRFRLVAARLNHRAHNGQLLKVTSKFDYDVTLGGHALFSTLLAISAADPVPLHVPKGKFLSPWIESKAPMEDGKDTAVQILHCSILDNIEATGVDNVSITADPSEEAVAFDVASATTYVPYHTFKAGAHVPMPGNGTLDYVSWSSPEASLVTASRAGNYNIHVYLLGGATPIIIYRASFENPAELEVDSQALGLTNGFIGENYCIIDADRDAMSYDLNNNPTGYWLPAKDRTIDAVVETIAHEIGHVIVGDGHPDEGGGVAPLLGTDRTKRLMCSGPNSTDKSKLLVKKEWDKAEAWMLLEEAAGRMGP